MADKSGKSGRKRKTGVTLGQPIEPKPMSVTTGEPLPKKKLTSIRKKRRQGVTPV